MEEIKRKQTSTLAKEVCDYFGVEFIDYEKTEDGFIVRGKSSAGAENPNEFFETTYICEVTKKAVIVSESRVEKWTKELIDTDSTVFRIEK